MRKLYEIFEVLKVQKGIVSTETIRGNTVDHGCVKSPVIERRQHQLGRMADSLPPVTFSVFDL